MRPLSFVRILWLLLMIVSLLLTMSSLGYLSLSFLVLTAPALYAFHALKKRSLAPGKVVIVLMVLATGSCLYLTTGASSTVSKAVKSVLLDKENSESYRERATTNEAAMETASETYYMGAGWGSARASGLMYELISNVGSVGVILFLAFMASLFLPMLRSDPVMNNAPSTYLYEKSLLALMVMMVGLLAAGAEPVAPILWALFATATAGKPRSLPAFATGYHGFLRPSTS